MIRVGGRRLASLSYYRKCTLKKMGRIRTRFSKLTWCRTLLLFILPVGVLTLYCVLTSNNSATITNWFSNKQVSRPDLSGYKTILIWNDPERDEGGTEFGYGHQSFAQQKCQVDKCAFYDKASSFLPVEDYDAVIVNMARLRKRQLPNFSRKQKQRFIFLTQESPQELPIFVPEIKDFFNWTMTYRLDSDVQLLYGRLHPGPTAPKTEEETKKLIKQMHLPSAKNYAANKTRQVAWMVSHCSTGSSRETYASQLGQFIPVDIYGKCGNLSCFRYKKAWRSHPKCYDMLEDNYKFYLSFENSICTDYVTEKFYEIINRGILPIVYGGANYSRIAPPHSYINALEFTPEKLADYLKLLDANDTLYNEYFWWKEHYRFEFGLEQMVRHGFCDLCKKLHQDENVIKSYPELVTDWHPNTQCRHFNSWETEFRLAYQLFDWLSYLVWFLF